MNMTAIGAGIVLTLAAAIVVSRQAGSRASTTEATQAAMGSATPAAANARVVLIADMGEAEDKCICGQIIRAVRAAAQGGVPTKEIDTRNGDEQAKPYNARVTPTVIFSDGGGKEVHRYEGESSDALKSIKRELDALIAQRK